MIWHLLGALTFAAIILLGLLGASAWLAGRFVAPQQDLD